MNRQYELGEHRSRTWIAVVGCLAVLARTAEAQQHQLFQVEGIVYGEDLGSFLLGPGDVDGDGFGDFVTVASWLAQQLKLRSGANGAVLWVKEVNETSSGEWLTSSAALTGDLDSDGLPDIVLGSMDSYQGGFGQGPNAGRVRAYSSASGNKLWEVVGEESNLFFGVAVAGMDDVDGDGIEDVAVGAYSDEPDPPVQGNVGRVRVLSGADGAEIYRIYGPAMASSGSGGPWMGGSLGRLPDLDGDGVDDLGVGSWIGVADTDTGTTKAPVWIVSGAVGSLIVDLPLLEYCSAIRPAFVSPGDLTADGIPEVVVGYSNSVNPGSGSNGAVILHEGGTWSVLAEWHADVPKEDFGGTLAIPGDVDGYGFADVLAGVRWIGGPINPPYGVVRLYSGRTYEELLEIQSDLPSEGVELGLFGRALAPIGDVNGDGAPEFAVGSQWSEDITNQGMVRVFSSRPLTLSTKAPWIGAGGGVQRLNFALGPAHVGEIYLVLGSATGIAPAVPLGPLALPLVPDAYTTWLLATGGGPLGPDFVGVLDAQGAALAKLTVPPLTGPLASLAGSVLWHAGLAFSPVGAVTATTNAVALTLLP